MRFQFCKKHKQHKLKNSKLKKSNKIEEKMASKSASSSPTSSRQILKGMTEPIPKIPTPLPQVKQSTPIPPIGKQMHSKQSTPVPSTPKERKHSVSREPNKNLNVNY